VTKFATDKVSEIDRHLTELVIGQESRRLFAEFVTSTDVQRNRVFSHYANLYLFADFYAKPWRIKTNLKSFEVLHGMSRVVLLIPDKLATAVEINREKLSDPHDGGFMVQLVIDLVSFYISLFSDIPTVSSEQISSRIEPLSVRDQEKDTFLFPEECVELSDLLLEFKDKLEHVKLALKERREEAIIFDCQTVVRMADSILELCNAYIDFVHPIYLDVERNGSFNDGKIKSLRKAISEKLAEQNNRLKDEFVFLTRNTSSTED